ncbi:MAG: arginine--tRNA ligase [Clostridium sp.]|jgi:arginyl-tRNA synthetase|nr:arginine--tRNA ligase [Clostridium sp.]MDY5896213.1 arginine--tRNA ligase [Oscillospiraceae bacterium]
MSLLVKQAIAELRTAIMDAAGRAVADGEFPAVPLSDFNVEVPANRDFGDYSANAAMAWARDLHCAPRKIAQALIDRMELCDTFFERCEVAGAGFLNFYLRSSFNACIIQDILEKGDSYGRSDYGRGKKINVEFVSANPTGPMHMGNARGGALGDCLAAVLDFAGYDVSREFYVNDAGNQIAKFGLSLDIRYQQLFLGEDAVQLPEDSYHGEDIIERAKEFAAVNGDKYMSASEQERRQALIDFALPKNIAAMKENMAKYRINYDTWFLESTLHNDGELEETLNIMRDKGLTYEKDGALWYKNKEVLAAKLREQGKSEEEIERLELKDEVLIRTNGNPTYFAADIAYHRNKLQIRGFDKAIDVWGADHHGHVARMKGALDAIGCNGDDLDIILMQLVRLTRDGEVVRMSKRSGKAITLVDLLEEIPIDAVRFLFNMREPGSQMDFDLDLAVEQSSQNPVYYCQYAHARICSILRKLASEGVEPRECTIPELALLTAPEEKELIKHLSGLTDEIIASAKNYDPAKITRYAVELATLFHKFYNACRVGVEDESLMQARLSLCLCVRTVLRNVLTMFSISVPESM